MWDGISLTSLTPAALVGLTVVLLLLGRLVPRRTLQDKAEDAKTWRLAYEAEREARAIADAHAREFLEVAKSTHAIVAALFDTVERAREGGADVVRSAPK